MNRKPTKRKSTRTTKETTPAAKSQRRVVYVGEVVDPSVFSAHHNFPPASPQARYKPTARFVDALNRGDYNAAGVPNDGQIKAACAVVVDCLSENDLAIAGNVAMTMGFGGSPHASSNREAVKSAFEFLLDRARNTRLNRIISGEERDTYEI